MNKLILKTTKSGLLAAALMASISASAETIEVKTLKYAGPYAVAPDSYTHLRAHETAN